MQMNIINPANGSLITQLTADDANTVSTKVALLTEGQPKWQAIALENRIAILTKFGELLKENIEELAGILTAEVGKPLQQSRNEINGACARFNGLPVMQINICVKNGWFRKGIPKKKLFMNPWG